MNDVCSATAANARRLCARMGWTPFGHKPTPQVLPCRTNPLAIGSYVFEQRSDWEAGLLARQAPSRLAQNA